MLLPAADDISAKTVCIFLEADTVIVRDSGESDKRERRPRFARLRDKFTLLCPWRLCVDGPPGVNPAMPLQRVQPLFDVYIQFIR